MYTSLWKWVLVHMLQRRTNEEVKLQRGRRQDDKDSGNWSGTEPTHSRSDPTKLNDLCFCYISGAKLHFFFCLFCFALTLIIDVHSHATSAQWLSAEGKVEKKQNVAMKEEMKHSQPKEEKISGWCQIKSKQNVANKNTTQGRASAAEFQRPFFIMHLETGAWEHNKHTSIRCLRCRRIKTSPCDKTSVTSPKNNLEI